MTKLSYKGCRFPPEIIHQAIWLYFRFTLSFRDVEDLLAERGIADPTFVCKRSHRNPAVEYWILQFALRLQLSANTHDMPEVRPVRPKKRSALIKPSLLLEATSHTAMGIAVGLAFAFLATHITALGIATLINYSPTPDVVMTMFVSTCAITFGIGATLTGLAITLTEDPETTGRE